MQPSPETRKRVFSHSGLSEHKTNIKRVDSRTKIQSEDFRSLSKGYDTDTSEDEELARPIVDNIITNEPNTLVLKPSILGKSKSDISSPTEHQTNMAEGGNANSNYGLINKAEFGELFFSALELPKNEEKMGNIVTKYTSDLKTDVVDLQSRVCDLELENKSLNDRIDALEQHNRNRTLRILYCYDDPDEEADDTVLSLSESLSLGLVPDDIDDAYRIGKYKENSKRILVVTFTTMRIRRLFYKARLRLKDNGFPDVIVSEDLTPARSTASFYCRELLHQDYLKDTWTYEGKVFAVSKAGGKAKTVSSLEKIENFAGVKIPRKPPKKRMMRILHPHLPIVNPLATVAQLLSKNHLRHRDQMVSDIKISRREAGALIREAGAQIRYVPIHNNVDQDQDLADLMLIGRSKKVFKQKSLLKL